MPIKFNKRDNLEPPLGISYIGAMLKKSGYEVFLKDYEVEDFREEKLLNFIEKNEIDIVGISFRTASYLSAKIFVKSLKKAKREVLIIAGGHHSTAFPKKTILDLPCDLVVKGEGEYTIIELVKAIEKKDPLSKIKGLTYMEKGEIVDNENSEPIVDLDKLPFPLRIPSSHNHYTVETIITSRGCPFSCIYCDKGISTRQVKFRSSENVYNEIVEIIKEFPGKRIYFVDDHFFLAKNHLYGLFDMIEKNNLHLKWICQARADGVNLEMLKRAKRVGCELIMYGIESGDPDELIYMKKQSSVEAARKALLATKEAGIRARANFMLGFPISTHKTVRNTIRFAKSVPLEVVRFFSVAPLPNTELWDRVYGKNVDFDKISWDKFDFYTPTYSTLELSPKDIIHYVGAAYIHVLKKKVFWELFATFIPRFFKLCYLSLKNRRIRGNLSQSFPSTVNLLLDLRTVVHSKTLYGKIFYFINVARLESSFKKRENK